MNKPGKGKRKVDVVLYDYNEKEDSWSEKKGVIYTDSESLKDNIVLNPLYAIPGQDDRPLEEKKKDKFVPRAKR